MADSFRHCSISDLCVIDYFCFVEVEIVSVGPNSTQTGNTQLTSSHVLLDIDLLGIAQNNNGSLMLLTDTVTAERVKADGARDTKLSTTSVFYFHKGKGGSPV